MSNRDQLLEEYIDALREDPKALPPLGLDVDSAHFARMIVLTKQRDTPDDEAKDRVWNQILFTMHAVPEVDEIPNFVMTPPQPQKEEAPQPVTLKQWRHHVVMVAATVFAVLAFSGLFISNILPGVTHTAADQSQVYINSSQPMPLDPDSLLMYRTVSMFSEMGGAGSSGLVLMSERLLIAE